MDLDATDGLGAVDALVVVDNYEHVIDAVADQIPTLLAGGEELDVLATSREPLGVPEPDGQASSATDDAPATPTTMA